MISITRLYKVVLSLYPLVYSVLCNQTFQSLQVPNHVNSGVFLITGPLSTDESDLNNVILLSNVLSNNFTDKLAYQLPVVNSLLYLPSDSLLRGSQPSLKNKLYYSTVPFNQYQSIVQGPILQPKSAVYTGDNFTNIIVPQGAVVPNSLIGILASSTNTVSNVAAQSQPRFQPQPRFQSQSQSQPQFQSQSQPQFQSQSQSQLQPQLQLQPQSQLQSKSQLRFQPQPQKKPQSQSSIKNTVDIEYLNCLNGLFNWVKNSKELVELYLSGRSLVPSQYNMLKASVANEYFLLADLYSFYANKYNTDIIEGFSVNEIPSLVIPVGPTHKELYPKVKNKMMAAQYIQIYESLAQQRSNLTSYIQIIKNFDFSTQCLGIDMVNAQIFYIKILLRVNQYFFDRMSIITMRLKSARGPYLSQLSAIDKNPWG